jgi:anti-sigma factor RsiW
MTVRPSLQGHRPAPIECETAVRRLWDYVDGRLPVLAHGEVQAHLATCILCAPSFAFARAMKEALGELGTPAALTQLDDEGPNALRARIQDVVRRAQAGDSTSALTPNGEEL